MCSINKKCVLIFISLLIIALGTGLTIFWAYNHHSMITKNLALAPDTENFRVWKNPQFDLYFDVYLYNWTNPCHLTNADYVKPVLKEIGPYRFREIHEKTKVQWHPKNVTISYKRKSTYHFIEADSIGRLDDKIVTINAFAVTVTHMSRKWNWLLQAAVSGVLRKYKHEAFIVKEARELMFDGYKDDLITLANRVSHLLPIKLDIPYDRFGWMYGRNLSDELTGHYNVNTGQDDISKLGETRYWNYQSATNYYRSPCNTVRGNGGEFNPPGQTKDRSIAVFNGELCRYLDFYFEEEQNINGIKSYKYAANEQSVDNGTKYSENRCFASGDTLPSGLMDVSACRYGAPVFISFPHFHAADPYYLRLIDGLSPSKSKHEMYLTIEPSMGLPIEIVGRMQANVFVQRSKIGIFKQAPTLYFPAFWVEQRFRLPDDNIRLIKLTTWIPAIGYICTGVLTSIGIFLLMCTFCCQKNSSTIEVSKSMYKKWLSKLGKKNPNVNANENTNSVSANANANANINLHVSTNGTHVQNGIQTD